MPGIPCVSTLGTTYNIIPQEGQNPNNGIESFDTVWYSALQVIVVASANTVSCITFHIADLLMLIVLSGRQPCIKSWAQSISLPVSFSSLESLC